QVPAPRGQTLGPRAVDAAVGDDRAGGEAELTTVGVPREREVVPVGVEPVQHAWLRRVQQPDPQVEGGPGGSGDLVVVVPSDVGVVDTGDEHATAVDGDLGALV